MPGAQRAVLLFLPNKGQSIPLFYHKPRKKKTLFIKESTTQKVGFRFARKKNRLLWKMKCDPAARKGGGVEVGINLIVI